MSGRKRGGRPKSAARHPSPRRQPRGRLWLWIGAGVVATGSVAAALWLQAGTGVSQPAERPPAEWEVPALDTTGMQPRVMRLLLDARQAVLAGRESANAWSRLAAVCDAHELFDIAATCYGNAYRLGRRDLVLVYNYGIVLYSLGHNEEALEQFRAAAQLEPDFPPIYVRIGQVLAAEGKLGEAREAHRKALQLDPNLVYAHHVLGNVLVSLGAGAEAVRHLEWTMQEAPRDGQVLASLARAYRITGQLDLARATAEKSKGLGLARTITMPDPVRYKVVSLGVSSEICEERAKNSMRKGDFASAARDLAIVAEVFPENAHIQFRLAMAYKRSGQPVAAMTHLRIALQLKDDLVPAHIELGSLLMRQGLPQQAMDHFRRALDYDPDNAAALGLLRAAGER